MRRLSGLVLAAIVLSGAMQFAVLRGADAAPSAVANWYEGASGYEQAFEEARRDQKPLMVYFRTEWCGYCRQFERELLSTETVQKYVDSVVKVTINPEAGREEAQIASAYRVRGFPAIFMHPADLGPPQGIRRTAMRDGKIGLQTPDEFVETLREAASVETGR